MTPEWDALSALHKIKAEDQYQVVRDVAKTVVESTAH